MKLHLKTRAAMILICAFAVGACGFGIHSAFAEKQKRETQAQETSARSQSLAGELAVLRDGREAYLADAASVKDGNAAYAMQKDAYRIGKETVDKHRAALAKSEASGALKGEELDEMRRELDQLSADLAARNENLAVYEKLRAKTDTYEKEKSQARAILEKLREDGRIRAKIEAGMGPVAAAQQAITEETAIIKRRFYITLVIFAGIGIAAVVVLWRSLSDSMSKIKNR